MKNRFKSKKSIIILGIILLLIVSIVIFILVFYLKNSKLNTNKQEDNNTNTNTSAENNTSNINNGLIEEISYGNKEFGLSVSITAPKIKGYSFITNDEDDNRFTQYLVVGPEISMLFMKSQYGNFNKLPRYVAKYGNNSNVNFDEYIKYLSDKEVSDFDANDIIKTTLSGRTALKYFYTDGITVENEKKQHKSCYYLIDINDIEENKILIVNIFPTAVDGEISSLLENEEVNNIINSIKIKKYE